MGSGGKKKTTMAKFARENRLRERRLNKQAKKDARKLASSDDPNGPESWLGQAVSLDAVPVTLEAPVRQSAAIDHEDSADEDAPHSTVHPQPIGPAPVGGENPPSAMSA